MKTWGFAVCILSTTLLGTTSVALAQESFSVSTCNRDLTSALNGSMAKASNLLQVSEIAKKALASNTNADRRIMSEARALYSKNQFDASLAKYNQISRGADQWLEAVEEKGWVFHRQKDFQKALAQTKTLLSKPFVSIVGSEPFFLQSLSQLKICDYKGILETHQLFKETQRQRLIDMQNLSKGQGLESMASKLAEKSDRFPLTFEQIGEEAKTLPRLFYRDVKLQLALLEMKMSHLALTSLRSTGKFPNQISVLEKKNSQARRQVAARIKTLAARESDANFKVLQKLNLIEVETIQRIHADQQMDPNSFTKGQFKQAGTDQLVFPDDGHPWIDELDKYQVRVNSCPQNIRRRM